MIKLSPLFSQKKNFSTDTRVNSKSSALHNFYAKVTCYRSTVITSINLLIWAAISSHKWNQLLEMVFSKGKFWNIQSEVTTIIIVSYEKQSIKCGFLLLPVVWIYFLFVCGFFFFIHSTLHNVQLLHPLGHKSSLLICCFFIHKMLFSFVRASTTLHTMFTMFNQSATIFIHW